MNSTFKMAKPDDADIIAEMVVALTTEICELTNAQHFDINLEETTHRCTDLLLQGHYQAILALDETRAEGEQVIGVVTMTETYALYAGGKIGSIQEFYIAPKYRASGVGSKLINEVQQHGKLHAWSCIELCTPPLPEFERTLNFYQKNGLIPVGGRKMRQTLS